MERMGIWLKFDTDTDDEPSHEAEVDKHVHPHGTLDVRVSWSHTAVGQVRERWFDTYADAAAWLTEGGYQDFTA